MTGWNMPPGVEPYMIPGNGPEDDQRAVADSGLPGDGTRRAGEAIHPSIPADGHQSPAHHIPESPLFGEPVPSVAPCAEDGRFTAAQTLGKEPGDGAERGSPAGQTSTPAPDESNRQCPECGWDDLYRFREYDCGTLDTAYDWCPMCNWQGKPE